MPNKKFSFEKQHCQNNATIPLLPKVLTLTWEGLWLLDVVERVGASHVTMSKLLKLLRPLHCRIVRTQSGHETRLTVCLAKRYRRRWLSALLSATLLPHGFNALPFWEWELFLLASLAGKTSAGLVEPSHSFREMWEEGTDRIWFVLSAAEPTSHPEGLKSARFRLHAGAPILNISIWVC